MHDDVMIHAFLMHGSEFQRVAMMIYRVGEILLVQISSILSSIINLSMSMV